MSTISEFNAQGVATSFGNCLTLCKPRVTALIVFTAVIGMFLATPGMVPLQILLAATIGIGMSSVVVWQRRGGTRPVPGG